MENKKGKIIVTDNGIRIKGDLSALSRLAQSDNIKKENISKPKGNNKGTGTANNPLDTSAKEKRRLKKEKKKELKELKKELKQKKHKKKETEAEIKRTTAAQKRIERFNKSITKPGSSSHSSFNVMQKREWILDWNQVMFKNGYMVIYAQSTSTIKFKPLKTYVRGSLESFNYLKKYLNERLPPVRCEIVALELKIIDEINFNEAIQQFAKAARQGVIKVKRGVANSINSPLPMSFSQALSRAKQMKPEDFQKYKSKFIDYLVTLQSKEYKVIPCVERLAHTTGDMTEFAFIFSLECGNGNIMIVHENVNPDRSTLIFEVKKGDYNKSIRSIYDFLQSAEINKRSSLRERNIEIKEVGVIRYRSINHDTFYQWKRTMTSCVLYNWFMNIY